MNPKKKIIFIDIDDEITAVYDRIKGLKVKDIYLVVPKRASLFNSVVNLKILKRKLQDLDKKLYLITNDPMGVHLAVQADITVYEKTEEELPMKEGDHPHLKISPIKALKNFLDDEKPIRLEQRKFSIFDLIKKRKKGGNLPKAGIPRLSLKAKLKLKRNKSSHISAKKTLVLLRSYRGTLGMLILASFVLLLIISYIALPGATIYLKPKSNVIEQSVNIILADYEKNATELGTHPPNMIASYAVIPNGSIKKIFRYNATGKIFHGTNARGALTIVNHAPRTWPLVAGTRFQSAEGFIFRLDNQVSVPAGSDKGPATLKVSVTADELDINGNVVGEKGNLPATKFFLPGLRESSQKLLYAYSEIAMGGGTTAVTKKVTKEDIEAAKQMAKNQIIQAIPEVLKDYVNKMNQANKTNLALLAEPNIELKRAITYDEPRIINDTNLLNKTVDSFEITAEVTARGVAYNYDEFVNILKRELKHRQLPQKRLTRIDEQSINYRIHSFEGAKFTLTATIRGVEEFELDPERENGKRLLTKIKTHIAGMSVKEAEKFIQNLDEIDRVEIKTWPVWAPTIPNLESNIKVSIFQE